MDEVRFPVLLPHGIGLHLPRKDDANPTNHDANPFGSGSGRHRVNDFHPGPGIERSNLQI
jgi:hypothetical protein